MELEKGRVKEKEKGKRNVKKFNGGWVWSIDALKKKGNKESGKRNSQRVGREG